MNYRSDHIRLLKVFAGALPKKTTFTVEALAKAAFSDVKKRKPDTALDADRACRNALRKPRAMGHVEIAERGEYRLTASGAVFCKKLDTYEVAPDKGKGEKKVKAEKTAKASKKGKIKEKVSSGKVSAKATAKASTKAEKTEKVAKAEKDLTKEPVAAKVENTKPRKRLIPGLKPKEEKIVVPETPETTVHEESKDSVAADLSL